MTNRTNIHMWLIANINLLLRSHNCTCQWAGVKLYEATLSKDYCNKPWTELPLKVRIWSSKAHSIKKKLIWQKVTNCAASAKHCWNRHDTANRWKKIDYRARFLAHTNKVSKSSKSFPKFHKHYFIFLNKQEAFRGHCHLCLFRLLEKLTFNGAWNKFKKYFEWKHSLLLPN